MPGRTASASTAVRRDVLDEEPPEVDVILAGDSWYEAGLATRVTAVAPRGPRRAASTSSSATRAGATSDDDLVELAPYEVRTTTELEDLDLKEGRVYRLRP